MKWFTLGFMNKKLRTYQKNTETKISNWKKLQSKNIGTSEKEKILRNIKQYYKHHLIIVRDFQHERLIHLLITLFFAGLDVAFVFCLLIFVTLPVLAALVSIVCILLTITEIFYVFHYYCLENGVQKLYQLSDELDELITSLS